MVTDDERREVAERLRHSWPKIADESATGRIYRFYLAIYESIYTDSGRHDFIELLERLADLVEPSDAARCVVNVKVDGDRLKELAYRAAVECAGVDREALLALADEIHGLVENQEIRFFHVVQVRDSTLATIEDRIREACGEVAE